MVCEGGGARAHEGWAWEGVRREGLEWWRGGVVKQTLSREAEEVDDR